MTIEEMKKLKVNDICKDIEISSNYRVDVFCKVTEVLNDRIEIDCIDQQYSIAYPIVIFYNTCSWRLENI